MRIRAWGPLFALIALLAAGLTGVGLQYAQHNNQPQPTKTEHRNGPTAKAIVQAAADQGDKKGKDEKGWTDPLLVLFNGLLTLFTWLLYRATQGLFKETAGLREAAAEQSRDMKASIVAAERAAESTESSNTITRDIFRAEQRPWLLWNIKPTITIIKDARHLTVSISGELTNIGRAPALNILYFGKLYSPKEGEPALATGMAYFDEHLAEYTRQRYMPIASALPTERIPMSFGPHGVDLASLPEDKEFMLWLSFHAVYEFAIGDRRYAEIGAVYCLQRVGGGGLTFNLKAISSQYPAVLVEYHGVRRIT